MVSARMLGASRALGLNPAAPPARAIGKTPWWEAGVAPILPFAVWWLFLLTLRVPEMLGKSPRGVVAYLFLAQSAGPAQEKLLAALAQTLPAALPWLFVAIRLTAPRALLGVMIAEWLATGQGLGNLLNQSRGYLDFGMIWTVAVTSVLISVGFHAIAARVERAVLRRAGMA